MLKKPRTRARLIRWIAFGRWKAGAAQVASYIRDALSEAPCGPLHRCAPLLASDNAVLCNRAGRRAGGIVLLLVAAGANPRPPPRGSPRGLALCSLRSRRFRPIARQGTSAHALLLDQRSTTVLAVKGRCALKPLTAPRGREKPSWLWRRARSDRATPGVQYEQCAPLKNHSNRKKCEFLPPPTAPRRKTVFQAPHSHRVQPAAGGEPRLIDARSTRFFMEKTR